MEELINLKYSKWLLPLLNLKEIPKPDDVADALAVAICHAHANKLEKTLKNIGEKRRKLCIAT